MTRQALAVLVGALVLSAVGCVWQTEPPNLQPLPTATVPPDFVAFTDESSGFAISYPRQWETAFSSMEEVDEWVKEFLKTEGLGDGGGIKTLFEAGVPTWDGSLDPAVSVTAESLPVLMSPNEYHEGSLKMAKELTDLLVIHSQSRVLLGGAEAILLDYQIPFSAFAPGFEGSYRTLQIITTADKVGWTVSCGVTVSASADVLSTCEAVVRSFRLLR